MLRVAICTLALLGFSSLASAQDSRAGTTQPSSSGTHIPSAGVTLDVLQSLPPPYRHWYPGGVYRNPNTQPNMYYSFSNAVPTFGYPPNPYGFRYSGMGGYYPPGAGGRYQSSIGFWLW